MKKIFITLLLYIFTTPLFLQAQIAIPPKKIKKSNVDTFRDKTHATTKNENIYKKLALSNKIDEFLETQNVNDRLALQLYFFTSQFHLEKTSKYKVHKSLKNKQQAFSKDSWLQAGLLLQPLLSLFFLDYFSEPYKKNENSDSFHKFVHKDSINHLLPQFQFSYEQREVSVTLQHLLSQTIGMSREKIRFYTRENSRDQDEILQTQLELASSPGSHHIPNPYVYAYLQKIWEHKENKGDSQIDSKEQNKQEDFSAALKSFIKSSFPFSFCIGDCESYFIDSILCSKNYCFPFEEVFDTQLSQQFTDKKLVFPNIHSLYISASNYGKFLELLVKKKIVNADKLLQRQFFYDKELGGVSYGFSIYKLSCHSCDLPNRVLLRLHSSNVDHASIAFLLLDDMHNPSSYAGGVILVNANDLGLVNKLQEEILSTYGVLDELPSRGRSPKQMSKANIKNWQGVYRPKNTLTHAFSWLNFLHEIRVKEMNRDTYVSDHNYIAQVDGMFRSKPIFFLQTIPDKKDTVLVRGNVSLNGSRLKVIRNTKGETMALQGDTILYEKVPVYRSGIALIFYLALLCFSPLFIALFFSIFVRKFE